MLIVALLWPREVEDERTDSFQPWAADSADPRAPDASVAVPREDYKRAGGEVRPPDTPPPKTQFAPDDTLNRPGPDPTEAGGEPDDGRERQRAPKQQPPTGTMDKETVQEGIRTLRPLLKVCYENLLEEFPDASGKVTLSFRIAAENDEGRVELGELAPDKTTLFDEKLHDCLLESIGEAKFPAPGGDGVVNVTYPFKFENDQEPEAVEE